MLPFCLAYNTSGFSNHRLEDCLRILATLGYQGVSITPDVHHLDPFQDSPQAVEAVARLLAELGLRVAIETGARFVLDPWRKHWPTLLSAEPENRARRADYLCRSIALAARLGAGCVSLWSGTQDPRLDEEHSWELLCEGLHEQLGHAAEAGVTLCLEPEPGMFVADMAGWEKLQQRLQDARLGLTLDLGHVACTESISIPAAVRRYGSQLRNVHIEDIAGGIHQHLPFGEGELDFPPILAALADVEYNGLLSVELGRDGHRAPTLARRARAFLQAQWQTVVDKR